MSWHHNRHFYTLCTLVDFTKTSFSWQFVHSLYRKWHHFNRRIALNTIVKNIDFDHCAYVQLYTPSYIWSASVFKKGKRWRKLGKNGCRWVKRFNSKVTEMAISTFFSDKKFRSPRQVCIINDKSYPFPILFSTPLPFSWSVLSPK